MRYCTDQRVEYLVGGAGKTCSDSIVSSPSPARAPTGTPKTQGASGQNTAAKFDDEGRREILQQELRLARQGLAELGRNPATTDKAGTLDEQRQRRQGDITALESELGRLKKSP